MSETEWGFGSGTVIMSTPEESIILTCAHHFRVKGQTLPAPKDFRVPITVDLFDGEITGNQPATVHCSEKDIRGEAIDYDLTNDVGLIRIRPGRVLAASRVVPPDWEPRKGMKMYTVGCSNGRDATAWDTMILDPRVRMTNSSTKQDLATIKCAIQPKQGRSGGGLFTIDGYVAGVCNFADPNEKAGQYAVPESIHRLLDRNGMAAIYIRLTPDDLVASPKEDATHPIGQESPASKGPTEPPLLQPAPEPPASDPVSDQARRLDELERKLDIIIEALKIDSLKDAKGDFDGSPPIRKQR
ncbi:S1 family peptidase [Tundrisphaera lichenicola]|uniref:S1 family peptidase n=1 Tax=Tundrisphaera lichenicola TaxID=2029860 RepID=UPI003EBCBC87